MSEHQVFGLERIINDALATQMSVSNAKTLALIQASYPQEFFGNSTSEQSGTVVYIRGFQWQARGIYGASAAVN